MIAAAILGAAALSIPIVRERLRDGVAVLVSFWFFLGETTAIPNWFIGVLFLCGAAVLCVGVLVAYEAFFGATPSTPSPSQYNLDTFFGMRWRWRYYNHHPSDLAMFCPFCDFQLIPSNPSAFAAIERLRFQCDGCGQFDRTFDMPYPEMESVVIRQIQQKLRTGGWLDALKANAVKT